MSFWHTVLAIVLGNAIYDLAHMWLVGRNDDDDEEDDNGYA